VTVALAHAPRNASAPRTALVGRLRARAEDACQPEPADAVDVDRVDVADAHRSQADVGDQLLYAGVLGPAPEEVPPPRPQRWVGEHLEAERVERACESRTGREPGVQVGAMQALGADVARRVGDPDRPGRPRRPGG
jgi:hypothetical protein